MYISFRGMIIQCPVGIDSPILAKTRFSDKCDRKDLIHKVEHQYHANILILY